MPIAPDDRLLELFGTHAEFTKIFMDAFALINASGKIIKFNQMFCVFSETKASALKKGPFINEILPCQTDDGFWSHLCLAPSPLRIDEVTFLVRNTQGAVNLDDKETPAIQTCPRHTILSYFPYSDENHGVLGGVVLLRDVTAEAHLQGKYSERTIQSITDPLTGLYTRRYFEEKLDTVERIMKETKHIPLLTLLMFDLDKFKSINDTFGHQAGDFVLAETAKILKNSSRKSDIVCRYGGEEILMILQDIDSDGGTVAAEKFRHLIAQHEYFFDGKRVPVSTSVGVSFLKSLDDNKEKLIARADKCLYAAKHNGRNRVFADYGNGEVAVKRLE